MTTAIYWDLDDEARNWAERWSKRMNGRKPTSIQAGLYSATLHYLKPVKAANSMARWWRPCAASTRPSRKP